MRFDEPEWIKNTKAQYSDMFAHIHPFNFGCGEGWKEVIRNLCQEIHQIDPNVRVVQVKEKFGTLRFYIEGCSDIKYDQVYAAIQRAEEASATTCEVCGQPGQLDTSGWLLTLCPEHKAMRARGEDVWGRI